MRQTGEILRKGELSEQSLTLRHLTANIIVTSPCFPFLTLGKISSIGCPVPCSLISSCTIHLLRFRQFGYFKPGKQWERQAH